MMTTDPVVRPIQIASALVDRLVELLKPRRGAQLVGLLSPEMNADALELRLGEAQQITPEIWRHLDDARNAMAARGLRVAGYDEIRTIPNPAGLAATDVKVSRKLDMWGLVQGDIRVIKTKTVEWDAGAIIIASLAIDFLKAEVPDVDWEALEREQNAEIAAAGSLKSERWKTAAKWGAGVVVLAGILLGGYAIVSRNAESSAATAKPATAPSVASQTKHAAKIAALKQKYAAEPCNKDTMRALTAYMFADGQQAESRAIEEKFVADCATEPATPTP